MLNKLILLFVFLAGFNAFVSAQEKDNQTKNKELFETIYQLDSSLFKAFNDKNFESIKNYFDSSLEFYHDNTGLTNYEWNMKIFKQNFSRGGDLTRTLLKETMEVYPVPGFGAVQMAQHRFCHTENGKQDCGTFKFIHVWKKTDSGWKITRIISVDH